MSKLSKYSPRTNTNVLKETGYKFQLDTYKPTQYLRLSTGWIRLSPKTKT